MAQDNRKGTPQSERDRGRQNPSQGQNPGGHNPHHSAIGDRGAKRSENDPQRQRQQNDDVDDEDQMDEDRDDDDAMTDDRDRGPSGAGA
jgi:hypothetical protein